MTLDNDNIFQFVARFIDAKIKSNENKLWKQTP